MKYYSENQVKKLLKQQIEECRNALYENRFVCVVKLPKGKEGSVYTYKQICAIENSAMNGILNQIDFYLD